MSDVKEAAGEAAGKCKHGCKRLAFREYDTCCTHCGGPEGPHARDCDEKFKGILSKHMYGVSKDVEEPQQQQQVIVRVVKAKLNRSFEKFGKMDPYATVALKQAGGEEGRAIDLGQTQIAKGADMEPEWNLMCRPVSFEESDTLQIRVLEANWGRPATFCGETASVSLQELLASAPSPVSEGMVIGELHELSLVKRKEVTGTVTVQLILAKGFEEGEFEPEEVEVVGFSCGTTSAEPRKRRLSSLTFQKVPESSFVTPVKRLGVSGGTAPFFELRLKDPPKEQCENHWIGKDLSHAMDEITFYEELLSMRIKGGMGLDHLFGFTFDYLGVLEAEEEGAEAEGKKQLLVLQNLRRGCKKLRMLDIKMGEQTACSGWQGKSRIAALRQGVIDGFTNSAAEGFRLEGFDGPPPVLESLDPLLDFRGADPGASARKKAFRLMLQRMTAGEAVANFTDMHQVPADVSTEELQDSLSSTEYAEIVLSETAVRLGALASACRTVPVPQKWIGSSVALGCDAGTLPKRKGDVQETVRKHVVVNIFDWGRSELNTLEKNSQFSAGEQADRLVFWKNYVFGIDRLAWEAARAHWQRFRNSGSWSEAIFDVYDFDSATENDFIGQARLPLPQTNGEKIVLPLLKMGHPVSGAKGPSSITVQVEWRDYPEGSRLKGAWRLTLERGTHLPGLDRFQGLSTSDPCVLVQAISPDGDFHFCQQTVVVKENVDPVWGETFELSVASPALDDELRRYLGGHDPPDKTSARDYFPPSPHLSGRDDQEDEKAFELYRKVINDGRRRSFGLVDTASSTATSKRSSITSGLTSLREFGHKVKVGISSQLEGFAPPHRGSASGEGHKSLLQ